MDEPQNCLRDVRIGRHGGQKPRCCHLWSTMIHKKPVLMNFRRTGKLGDIVILAKQVSCQQK